MSRRTKYSGVIKALRQNACATVRTQDLVGEYVEDVREAVANNAIERLDFMVTTLDEEAARVVGDAIAGNDFVELVEFKLRGSVLNSEQVPPQPPPPPHPFMVIPDGERFWIPREAPADAAMWALLSGVFDAAKLTTHDPLPRAQIKFHSMRGSCWLAQQMGAALADTKTLRVLNLHDNRITDVGAAALAEGVAKAGALERLVLTANYIGDAGLARLCEATAASPSMRRLDIGNNPISDEGMAPLIRLIEHGRLRDVGAGVAGLTPATVDAIRAAALRSMSIETVHVLRGSVHAECNLSYRLREMRGAFFAVAGAPRGSRARRFFDRDGDRAVMRRVAQMLARTDADTVDKILLAAMRRNWRQ